MTLDATYTFTDAQNADDGERLLRRPQNTASLNATITPLPGLTIVPELLLTGAFQDFLIDNNGFSTQCRDIAARADRQPDRDLRRGAARPALRHRPQHIQFALRAGERLSDARRVISRRRARAPVATEP